MKKKNLPYFKQKSHRNYYILTSFLRRKFLPSLKKQSPQHYLINQNYRKYLKFIKLTAKKYPFFLRFDVEKYFPSVNHQTLLEEITLSYQELTNKSISRRFKKIIKYELPKFLKISPFINQGLSLGSGLSHILAGIYLLKLDLKLKLPFLRVVDDYLIFGKNHKKLERLLSTVIVPTLEELKLSLNVKKVSSGRFHKDKLDFLGFSFHAGYFKISDERIEDFKQKIKEITYLTNKKETKAVIKQLNNKILGFGNYYKLSSSKQVFERLDGFIRSRLRRYINRNKDSYNKQANLILTNPAIKSLGLKSLREIYQRYSQKNRYKFKKIKKIKAKTGKLTKKYTYSNLEQIETKYQYGIIIKKLQDLTTLITNINKKLTKIEEKIKRQN